MVGRGKGVRVHGCMRACIHAYAQCQEPFAIVCVGGFACFVV